MGQCRYIGCSPYRDLAWHISCDIYRIRSRYGPGVQSFFYRALQFTFFPPRRSARNFGAGGGGCVLQGYCTIKLPCSVSRENGSPSRIFTARTEHRREFVRRSALPLLSAHEATRKPTERIFMKLSIGELNKCAVTP